VAYEAPSITAAGLSIPSYTDILNLITSSFQQIYGPGIYLGTDSPDYQLASIFALACADALNAVQLDYNNRAPLTAVGAALDGDVAYNGLIRKPSSYSTCAVTLTGVPSTVIIGGKVLDSVPGQGYLWDLAPSVTIPSGGSLNTIVTCEVIGTVNALANQLNQIATPTSGWTSVNNTASAALGQPIETDSQLRTRQALSTLNPSSTLLGGTAGKVSAVTGVTRSLVLENQGAGSLTVWPIPSGSPYQYGTQGHSITAIVEGGADADIASAIYYNRGIGCDTSGSGLTDSPPTRYATTVDVYDSLTGQTFPCTFYRPVYAPIYVVINAHALGSGFTTAVQAAITTAIYNYLNGLSLGATVSWSALNAVAMTAAGNIENPTFDVTTLYLATTQTSPPWTFTTKVDIPMTYPWQVASIGGVQINSV